MIKKAKKGKQSAKKISRKKTKKIAGGNYAILKILQNTDLSF